MALRPRVYGAPTFVPSVLARWVSLIAVLCAFLACDSRPKLARLPADARVLAFGDSLTFGTGANPQASYPAVLQLLINREIVNAGVPGEVSGAGLERLAGVLDEVQPTLLLLCHGGNDFLRNLGEQQAAANIRAMIQLARERRVAVVLIAVPKFGILLSPAEFYGKIGEELDIPVETGTLSRIVRDSSLKADAVHPNEKGYRLLAESLASLLKSSGAI